MLPPGVFRINRDHVPRLRRQSREHFQVLIPLFPLQALRLDGNRLEDINGLLTAQLELQWLNVSHNRLQWFDYAFVPKSLLWLNMANNEIEELQNYYDMHEGFHLAHLDASFNKLTRLDSQMLMESLQEVGGKNIP